MGYPPKAIAINNDFDAAINDGGVGDFDPDYAVIAFGFGFLVKVIERGRHRTVDELLVVTHPPTDQVADIFANIIDHVGGCHREANNQFADLNFGGVWVMVKTD